MSDKFVRLLERLESLTQEKSVEWETTAEDEVFRLLMKSGFVKVGRRFDYSDDGESHPYLFAELMDERGRRAEELNNRNEASEGDLLNRLYLLASRDALKADEVLDRMLNEIEPRTPVKK